MKFPDGVGYKFSTWSTPQVPCAACKRLVTAGTVRVDRQDPRAEGFAVICTDCMWAIDRNLDPVTKEAKPGGWA